MICDAIGNEFRIRLLCGTVYGLTGFDTLISIVCRVMTSRYTTMLFRRSTRISIPYVWNGSIGEVISTPLWSYCIFDAIAIAKVHYW